MATTIEDLYEEIGGMGRFQIIAVCTLASHLLPIGWSMMQMTFAGALPDFTCVENMTTGYTNWTMNACADDGASCAAYEYHTSSRTIITEWNLVCDLQWTKKLIITLQMVGVLVGATLCGQMGDMFGRKKVLNSFALAHVILNIVAAFSMSWAMFACLRFLIGVCIGAVILIIIPYQLEFLPLKWRPLCGVVPSWSLGIAIFALAAYIFHDWSYLHLSCGVISIPSLLGNLFIPESVRWLALHGRLEEAENVIRRIARINKKEVRSDVRFVINRVYEEQANLKEKSKKYTYVDLFKRWRTARVAMTFFYIWLTMAIVYYGISFGVASLSGNMYVNIFLLGIVEIPVQTTTLCLNNRLGRRKTTFMFFTLSFLPVLGCLLFHLFSPSDHLEGLAINVLSQIAKVNVGAAWSAVTVWGAESFPTVMRNLGCGFQTIGGRVGGILAPLVIDLDTRMAASYAVLSGMLLLTMIFTLSVPETKGKSLHDNIQKRDAEMREIVRTGKNGTKALFGDSTQLQLSI